MAKRGFEYLDLPAAVMKRFAIFVFQLFWTKNWDNSPPIISIGTIKLQLI